MRLLFGTICKAFKKDGFTTGQYTINRTHADPGLLQGHTSYYDDGKKSQTLYKNIHDPLLQTKKKLLDFMFFLHQSYHLDGATNIHFRYHHTAS